MNIINMKRAWHTARKLSELLGTPVKANLQEAMRQEHMPFSGGDCSINSKVLFRDVNGDVVTCTVYLTRIVCVKRTPNYTSYLTVYTDPKMSPIRALWDFIQADFPDRIRSTQVFLEHKRGSYV
jgi:hypothetical protein